MRRGEMLALRFGDLDWKRRREGTSDRSDNIQQAWSGSSAAGSWQNVRYQTSGRTEFQVFFKIRIGAPYDHTWTNPTTRPLGGGPNMKKAPRFQRGAVI
jgi:hypothetical protein